MKHKTNIIIFALILLSISASAQIQFTAGLNYESGVPSGAPSSTGSRIRVDLATGRAYIWNQAGSNWRVLAQGIDIVAGCSAPLYTPGYGQSLFAVNGCASPELYYYTGAAWVQINAGGGGGSTDALRLKFIVVNKSGGTINKGEVVYVSGAQGNRVAVKKALASFDSLSANTLGVMDETVANNAEGYCVAEGLVSVINTSAFTEGAALYLSPTTEGGITQTKTTAPDHLVLIGYCVKSNAGSGEISVHIQNGYELGELHDVYVPSPLNGQVLTYNTTNERWQAATVADQSATNELQTIDTFSLSGQTLSASLSSDAQPAKTVTLPVTNVTAGTGISVSSTTGNYTVTNSAPDQTVSIANGGGIGVTGSYPSFTLTATDQSITNEIQRLDTFSLSGQTLRASLLNDGVAASSVTLPIVDVVAGTNVTVTKSNGVATVSATGGGGGGTPAGSAGEVQFNSTPAGSFAASSNLAWDNSNVRLNIGAPSSPTGRLNVKGSGTTSSTVNLRLTNSGNTEIFRINDDGSFSSGTSATTIGASISGGLKLSFGSSEYGFFSSPNNMHMTQNAYYDGSWKSYGPSASRGSAILFQTNGINNRALSILVDNNIATANESLDFTSLFSVGTNGNAIFQSLTTDVTPAARLHLIGANTTAGVGAFLVQDGAATPATIYRIDNNGKVTYRANAISGTTGNQTIDQPSGNVNFAAGATALTVTNSLCTSSSLVFATVRTNDATAVIKNVVASAGSFTINLGAAATAVTSVGFFIIN